MNSEQWTVRCKETFGFAPSPGCDNCVGTGYFRFPYPEYHGEDDKGEACHFCLSDAIRTGQLDGVADGVRYCNGIAIDLLGVEWAEDFGVVDLKEGRVLMYGYSKRSPHLCWSLPVVTLTDEDFAVLVPEAELPELTAQTENDRDEVINDYANWGHVVQLLLSPKFKMRDWLKPAPREKDDAAEEESTGAEV